MEERVILDDFPDYVIYQDGRVYSNMSHKFLKFQKRGGYYRIRLYQVKNGDRKRVDIGQHQLVSRAFIPNDRKVPIPNHKDGDGYNNDIDNLEWLTFSENRLHAQKSGLVTRYSRPILQYTEEGEFVQRFNSCKEAGKAVGCCPQHIGRVCRGKKKTAKGYIFKYETEDVEFHALDGEEWKKHPQHLRYKISTYGRIYSLFTKRFIKPARRKDGYLRAKIDGKHYYVHVLVAETFLGEPPEYLSNPVVDHIDENKSNNKLSNLEWVEFEENVLRAHRSGKNSTSRPCIQYDLKGREMARYRSVSEAAKKVRVSHTSILSACHKAKNVHTICGCIWRFEDEPLRDDELESVKVLKSRVEQYSLTGEKIGSFESIKEAAEKTGINRTSISQTCRGKANTAGGFAWCYEGKHPHIPERIGSEKAVEQIDKNGNVVKVWKSAAEAGRQLNISSSHIASVCKGKRKTSGGYIWNYVE